MKSSDYTITELIEQQLDHLITVRQNIDISSSPLNNEVEFESLIFKWSASDHVHFERLILDAIWALRESRLHDKSEEV